MKKILMSLSLLLACANLYAAGEDKVVDLGEKNIYSETGFETSLRSSTSSSFIVDSKMIEKKKYSSVKEILNDIPGLIIIDNDVNIRGQKNSRENVQLLVDGVVGSIMETSHKSLPFEVVNVNEIERIEVIPGGGAVLYGSGTAGGVINIITKNYQGTHGNVGFRYGSYNNKIADIGAGTSLGPIDLNLSYRNDKGDGYRREHEKHDTDYFNGKIRYNFNKTDFISLKYERVESEGENPDNLSKKELKKDRRMSKDASSYKNKKEQFTLNSQGKITKNNILSFSAFSQKMDFSSDYIEKKKGFKIKNKYIYGDNSNLILGLGYSKNDMERGSISSHWFSKYSKEIYEASLRNTYKYNKFEFTQGLRFENSKYEGFRISTNGTEKIKNKLSENVENFAGELSANYLYSDTGNVYIKYERGFTSPPPTKITNKLKTGKTYTGFNFFKRKTEALPIFKYVYNDLKSEKSNTFELGWNDYLLNSLISADIYYSETKDEITTIFGGNGIPNPLTKEIRHFNIGKTRRYGFDLKAEQKFDKLTLRESYSFINAKIVKHKGKKSVFKGMKVIPNPKNPSKPIRVPILESQEYTLKNKNINYVPAHKFTLGMDYAINDKFDIGLDGSYTSDYYLNLENTGGKAGKKLVFNLRANYEAIDGLNIYAGINNLFNNKYNDSVGINRRSKAMVYSPAPTRNYYAGFSYKF